MASLPYQVGLIIQYPLGTILANVNVTVRVESTNESASKTTNSSGEVIFNLGNASGYLIGDNFTYVVLYTGYEAYGSHTISSSEGGWTKTIVLTAVPTAPSLRYFTSQDFLDFFNLPSYENDTENGVKIQQIVKIGQMVEANIDSDTSSIFDNNNGSYYAKTEYIDTDKYQQEYFLSNTPIYSITNCYTTSYDEETVPDYTNHTTSWNSLTEGTDFVVNKGDVGTGRIQITNSSYYPINRNWGLYVTYKQGRTSVPSDIKMLAIVETGLKILGAKVVKSKVIGTDSETGELSWFTNFRRNVINNYLNNSALNT